MIFGTCSHEIPLDWFESGKGEIKIKDHNREGQKVIAYCVVCETCLVFYHKNGLILHNEDEENKWLNS